MLAYKKDRKFIDGSHAFLNAIRLIVFLNAGDLVKIYQKVSCFLKISISYDNRNFTLFLINFIVARSCLHGFEMRYGCI